MVHDDTACLVTSTVAAHAISDHPEPLFFIDEQRILIDRPDITNVGALMGQRRIRKTHFLIRHAPAAPGQNGAILFSPKIKAVPINHGVQLY